MATNLQDNINPEPENLIFACSGAADVGAIADHAARALHRDGAAHMQCIAAIGAGNQETIGRTHRAATRIVIDGCSKGCAQQCLIKAGIVEFDYLNLESMGMAKGATQVSMPQIEKVMDKVRGMLQQAAVQ